jgi:hypothetical protein
MLENFGTDIEVASAQFVEQGDTLVATALLCGYLPCDLLTQCDVQAELG